MAGRPHRLKSLSVNEISLVDAPANPGAIHLLFKRKDTPMPTDAEIAAAKKAKDSSVLERLMTRLGLGKRGETGTVDPDTYADAASAAIDEACKALTDSIASIMADAEVSDKAPAIAKSLAEFRAFTADAAGEQIEKAMRDVALLTKSGKDDTTMPTPEEQIAALTKQLADAQLEVAISKLSSKHAKHMAGLTTDAAKSAFMAKSPAERDAACEADDVGKSADPLTTVALTKAQGEIEDLNKRIAAFEADKEMSVFRKRATDIGLAETHAEMLLKASKGDDTEFTKLLTVIKSATEAARTGGVFKEFGATGGTGTGGGQAAAEVQSKAETLIKADPKLSLVAARVAVRKSDLTLAQRERDEERTGARV